MTLGDDDVWQRKGATLSDATARKEFGRSQGEIVQAIRGGTLQYRRGSAHGNPFLRLLRREVEALVKNGRGDAHLRDRQTKAELARLDRELRQLRRQLTALEERRALLLDRDVPLRRRSRRAAAVEPGVRSSRP